MYLNIVLLLNRVFLDIFPQANHFRDCVRVPLYSLLFQIRYCVRIIAVLGVH